MKSIWGTLAAGASLTLMPALMPGALPTAQAQDCCPGGRLVGPAAPWQEIDDEDAADAEIREVEARLGEILVVDETGKIHLREEFKEGLPFPPQRLEAMLATFVELGEDGKIRLRNPDMIRPYLPMIRGFLSRGGLDKLREMQELAPEERREAMRRLFRRGGAPDAAPDGQDEGRQDERRRADRETRPRGERGRERRGRAEPGQRDPGPDGERAERGRGRRGAIVARLERIERSMQRIERMLERMTRGERGLSRRDDEREGRGGLLRRLFERGFGRRRDSDRAEGRRDRRGAFGGGMGELMERSRVWGDGVRRLREIMEPEDLRALGKALEALGRDMDPSELRDMDAMKLFGKLEGALSPEETARLMEVFSEFLATPEGRDLASEVERSVKRLESAVNSPDGARMLNRLRRLGERLGQGGQLPDRLEDLIRGRDRDRGGEAERPRERRSARRNHGESQERDGERERERERNPRAKLY